MKHHNYQVHQRNGNISFIVADVYSISIAETLIRGLKEAEQGSSFKYRILDNSTGQYVPSGFELSRSKDCTLPLCGADTLHTDKPIFDY